MLKQTTIILFIGLLVLSSAFAQEIEPLIEEFHKGNRDEVIARLEKMIYKNPNNPGVKYLRALVQDNALMSTGIYKDIIRKYPNTKYAKLSQVQVAEYYFSQGLYRQSRQLFKEVLAYNLDDFDMRRVGNQCLRAGIASRLLDSSKVDLYYMMQRFPHIQFDIPQELASVSSREINKRQIPQVFPKTGLRPLGNGLDPSNSITSEEGQFGLQIGAFSTVASANEMIKRINAIQRRGEIKTKIVNGKTLHVVTVGRYATRNDAISDKKNINRKLNTSSFIIKFE